MCGADMHWSLSAMHQVSFGYALGLFWLCTRSLLGGGGDFGGVGDVGGVGQICIGLFWLCIRSLLAMY